jgi:hypothetical protein
VTAYPIVSAERLARPGETNADGTPAAVSGYQLGIHPGMHPDALWPLLCYFQEMACRSLDCVPAELTWFAETVEYDE